MQIEIDVGVGGDQTNPHIYCMARRDQSACLVLISDLWYNYSRPPACPPSQSEYDGAPGPQAPLRAVEAGGAVRSGRCEFGGVIITVRSSTERGELSPGW